jgi:predicted flap endonuclease-1-like 5' DNA nuclease
VPDNLTAVATDALTRKIAVSNLTSNRNGSVMEYLIATYWMWFVVALLAGGAVGYWLPGRLVPEGGIGHLLRWSAAASLIGLAFAVVHWFPPSPELDFEMLLLLSFWFTLGGLLTRSLRVVMSQVELARAARAKNAQVESAALSARAWAAVRSFQDAAASTKAMEDARLDVEAKASEVMRIAAAAKATAEERLAAEAKATEEAAEKAAEEARVAAAAKVREDERLAAEAKAAEEARLAAEAKTAETETAETETAETETAGDDRLVAETKAAEEARIAAATKAVQDARLAAETKAAEEARVAAAVKAVQDERQDERLAAAAKVAEQAQAAATAKAAEEPGLIATAARPGAFHSGSRPQGIAAPAEGEVDDLKLINGIGPKTENACNALGIYWFRQIADWTPEEAIWVGHHIAYPGRIEREHWIAQARLLASGGDTEHSSAVKSGALVVDDEADEPLDPAAAETLGENLPEQAAVVDGEGKHPGRRPYGLAAARGKPDNLKRIRGIGPQNEGRLRGLGIWHFAQIAAWSDENVKWVGSYLAFSGRIHRENWVAQARDLVAGKEPEAPRRAAARKVPTPKDDGSLGEGNLPTSK